VSYGVFGADLSFLSSEEATIERRAASASFERRMSDTWTLSFAAGAGLPGGYIEMGGERHTIGAGWLVAVSSSWRLLDGRGRFPLFALLSLTLAGSGVGTERAAAASSLTQSVPPSALDSSASMYAVDARLGLIFGKTFWDVFTPYAGARLFGGPVFWRFRGEDVIGGDTRHIQLALGASSSLPGGVDLFAEVAPFGERAATVGGGVAF
jgi:hypothetical protein